jgi:ABC-2 type transport system permease protein
MTSVSDTTDIAASNLRPLPHSASGATSRVATCWTLYVLSLRQHLHGKRWIALAVLFLLPAGMAIVIRESWAQVPPLLLDFTLDWILVPQAILPLIALLYASGIIQDEQEDQTITYLLIRPLPKWLLYVVKMLATWTTTVVLVVVLTLLTYLAIYFRSDLDFNYVASRFVKTAAIHSLAVIAYSSIFGLVGVLTRPSLVVGVVYTVLIEGVLANLPLSLRMGTVVYYSRIIAYRAMDFVVHTPSGGDDDVAATVWFLDTSRDPKLVEHPQLWTCVLVLVVASIVCTVVAASLCSQREFHVKTPEKD